MSGIPGTVIQLSHIGPQYPSLRPEQVVVFAHRGDQATPWEVEAIGQFSLTTIALEEVAKKPEMRASQALSLIEKHCNSILVHFDVDAIDFMDMSLSENTGRNIGLRQETALHALTMLFEHPRVTAYAVTELNREHGEPDGITVKTFTSRLAAALCGSQTNSSMSQRDGAEPNGVEASSKRTGRLR